MVLNDGFLPLESIACGLVESFLWSEPFHWVHWFSGLQGSAKLASAWDHLAGVIEESADCCNLIFVFGLEMPR